MEKENKLSFCVYGRQALFSDPVTRVGGEKMSYSVPTYEALKGSCESIYWKPTFIWVVDRVRIMNRIRTQSRGQRVGKFQSDENDLSIYTYLADVRYQVEAHFEWNENRPELACDRNENKHFFIAKRMLERGGRRDIFLGTRECQGYVEPCVFGEGEGAYDRDSISGEDNILSFGIMLHGISYPDETGLDYMQTRLWDVIMKNGVIDFVRPEECRIWTRTAKGSKKIFGEGNFTGLGEFEEEGIFFELDQ